MKWGKSGFSMLELMATLVIVAMLLATLVAFVGSWVSSAKKTADRQTLMVLNDAITRYKTEGGVISALTYGKPFTQLATALGTPVNWCGLDHQFLKSNDEIRNKARTIAATGDGRRYRLTRYNTYAEEGTEISSYITMGGNWWVSTFAGTSPGVDGVGTAATFGSPNVVAVDGSGNVYVSDTGNCSIRKITPAGVVTTLAGGVLQGVHADGTGAAAGFTSVSAIAADALGNLYVGDSNWVRKITPEGVVTTVAGNATYAYVDGTGTAASFSGISSIAVDASGNVYVGGSGYRLRKITPEGVVTTLAGSGSSATVDGTGTAASFVDMPGLVVDGSGDIYVAGWSGNKIRKVTPAGVVTTFAGSGAAGRADETGTAATFYYPISISMDGSGNFYVSDYIYHLIRKITPAGVVTTLAGTGSRGSANGTGTAASFGDFAKLAADSSGNVYVADLSNKIVRKMTPATVVTTFAGSSYEDGIGVLARFKYPEGVAVDGSGNVFVADTNNHRIRKITSAGVVTTLAGSGSLAYANGTGTAASFSFPTSVAVDGSGNVYVADYGNNRIRKITSAGVVTTLAGSGSGAYADGTSTAASFYNPSGVAVDGSGNVYVADRNNNRIRKITSAGVVTTLAGSGSGAYADGTGTAASFNNPSGVAVDSSGNVFVADTNNNRIRKITPAGVVVTLAGSGQGYVDGTGTGARFKLPEGVAVDGSGNVYVADASNHRIRKITSAGVVTTLAGSGSETYADGAGTAASFNYPRGVAAASPSLLYVADSSNNVIRKVERK